MVLKAAHVTMCRHTVGTEEVGAVATTGKRFLPCLATGAYDLHVVDGQHVKELHEHMVEWQRLNATYWQCDALLTQRACNRSTKNI